MKLTDEEKKERRRKYDRERYLRLRPEPIYPKPPRDTSTRPTTYKKRTSNIKTISIDFAPELVYEQNTEPVRHSVYGDKIQEFSDIMAAHK